MQPLKDWKTKYDYVGAVHDGRILVHRGGEGSNPRMGRFYTDGCFGYTDTCGTVVFRSSMTMPIVFPMGLPWSAKGKRTIVVSGLSIVRGVKSCPVSMRMSRVFRQALPGYRRTDSVRRYGYVDTLGQVVIPLKYDYARIFPKEWQS